MSLEYDEDKCPLPYSDFNKFCEFQSNLLLRETDLFFDNHNLRLKKYVLPVTLPEWAKTFGEVLDRGEEYDPLTTIYRHRHFLKCRILHNYSYIETKWNRSSDARNKNIPFDLRPLTSEILNQLDIINEDMLDPEFSGLLVTLNTSPYTTPNYASDSSNDESGDTNSTGSEEGQNESKMSKIIAGALVECLITNERCIKSIWLHPSLTKHSSRILLQSFLPRLMYEIFLLPSVMTENGVSKYNKFTYCMHNDLDLFPRQCWLLLASNRKMSLPRHYEPSTFEEHPVQLEYGDCHTDEVGYLNSQSGNPNATDGKYVSKSELQSEPEEEITISKKELIELNGKVEVKRETESGSDGNVYEEEVEEDEEYVQMDNEMAEKSDRIKRPRRSCAVHSYSGSNGGSNSSSSSSSSKGSNRDGPTSHKRNLRKSSRLTTQEGRKNKQKQRTFETINEKLTNSPQLSNNEASDNTEYYSNEEELGMGIMGSESNDEMNETVKEVEKSERLTKMMTNNSFRKLRDLISQVGSINSTRDVSCSCRREKLKKSVDDQAWLDRLVGCTENYMYLMLPKRQERARLGLLIRDGWRDLVVPNLDLILLNDINNILPEYARNQFITLKNPNNVNYNADVEEWCRLKREDLIDVTSDTEVYMRLPENAGH